MLTREENELLCRVGPGSVMGDFLREYWVPALRADSLQADGAPKRVRLMGENFVAFRSTDGRVGLFDEGCPHRCTSLALARNEDNALTCIFHGWKIDVSGRVVEVPSEPPERRAEFAAKVRVRHFPVREAGGIVWTYLGRRQQPPPFYNFEFNLLPAEHVMAWRALLHCNWFQGMEAVLDSAHVGFLHRAWLKAQADGGGRAALNSPTYELIERPYGFREGALRDLRDGTYYARIREVVLPFYSFIPNDRPMPCLMICAIPVDDEWNAQWYVWYEPDRPMDRAEQMKWMGGVAQDRDNFCSDMGGFDNLWHQDREAMREGHWTGLTQCFQYEDFVVEESMGPIVNRSREYLGMSDAIILRVRRQMMQAAREFRKSGQLAFGNAEAIDYSTVRALAVRERAEINWREIDSFAPRYWEGWRQRAAAS
ncbi:MAG TPA: Rieske 2Fe-2S domain-containing protein [Candidatus Binataceae bacterium]|nr:Rieske 2Fe-2S domain-containing protein [Candidatus Binataceae bacterium]